MSDFIIRNAADVQALFGPVAEASIRKQVDFLHPTYRAWLEASPFAVIGTCGPDGLDVSPRGDPAPLVRVLDGKTLLLPERRGNNRIDSLLNLVADPRISLLFLVPGVGETLRINGMASISADPELLQSFAVNGALPKCVIKVSVDAAYFQCARAMLRSKLWASVPSKPAVPTAGQMLAAITDNQVDGTEYDQALSQRQQSTLY
jgi:PPOX class probable FMN-dependent enzyme